MDSAHDSVACEDVCRTSSGQTAKDASLLPKEGSPLFDKHTVPLKSGNAPLSKPSFPSPLNLKEAPEASATGTDETVSVRGDARSCERKECPPTKPSPPSTLLINESQKASGSGTNDEDGVGGDERSCERKQVNEPTELPVQKPAQCGTTSVSALLHMNAFPPTHLILVTGCSTLQSPPGK